LGSNLLIHCDSLNENVFASSSLSKSNTPLCTKMILLVEIQI
jgi:hypothetical protein